MAASFGSLIQDIASTLLFEPATTFPHVTQLKSADAFYDAIGRAMATCCKNVSLDLEELEPVIAARLSSVVRQRVDGKTFTRMVNALGHCDSENTRVRTFESFNMRPTVIVVYMHNCPHCIKLQDGLELQAASLASEAALLGHTSSAPRVYVIDRRYLQDSTIADCVLRVRQASQSLCYTGSHDIERDYDTETRVFTEQLDKLGVLDTHVVSMVRPYPFVMVHGGGPADEWQYLESRYMDNGILDAMHAAHFLPKH